MSGFHYIKNKRTGMRSRTLALPFMGQNSEYEVISEEEYRGNVVEKKPAKAKAKAKAKVVEEKPESLTVQLDLFAGLEDAEDGR